MTFICLRQRFLVKTYILQSPLHYYLIKLCWEKPGACFANEFLFLNANHIINFYIILCRADVGKCSKWLQHCLLETCFTRLLLYKIPNNSLHAEFFSIISHHCYGIGSWDPSFRKTEYILTYIVNIMVTVVLATQGARAQGISSHGNDLIFMEYHGISTRIH